MAEDLDALWEKAKPAKGGEDLDALWARARPPTVTVHTEARPAWANEMEVDPPSNDGPSQGGVAFRSGVRGSLQGFADELSGKTYEAGSYLRNVINGLDPKEAESRRTEDYRHGRDTDRASARADRRAFPKTAMAAGIAGDAATQAVMAAGTGGATLTPGGLALTSGLSALGNSEADLTRGEYGQAVLDTGGGAATGYLLGKGGEFLAPSAKGFIQRRIGKATGDAAAEVERKAAAALKSGVGRVGGTTSAGRNAIEVATEIANSPHATPEQIAEAKRFLASPEAGELLRGVYSSALEQAPQRLGAITESRAALGPLQEAAGPAGIAKATEERLSGAGSRIASRWPHALNKLLPIAAGAIGFKTGHEVAGGLIAGAMALGSGHGGTVVKNLLKDPAIRRAAWGLTEAALQGGGHSLGKFGPFLAREYQRDPEHARAIDEALMSEEPGYAEMKLQLVRGAGNAE